MSNDTIQHPVAVANRVALAHRIVTALDSSPDLFPSGVRVTAEAVANFGPAVWAIVNNRTVDLDGAEGRDRPISATTIAVVIGLLAARDLVGESPLPGAF